MSDNKQVEQSFLSTFTSIVMSWLGPAAEEATQQVIHKASPRTVI